MIPKHTPRSLFGRLQGKEIYSRTLQFVYNMKQIRATARTDVIYIQGRVAYITHMNSTISQYHTAARRLQQRSISICISQYIKFHRIVFLDKLIVAQLLKKFPFFYGIWFIIMFTTAWYCIISQVRSITSPHPIFLILSSHLHPISQVAWTFPSKFSDKFCKHFWSLLYVQHGIIISNIPDLLQYGTSTTSKNLDVQSFLHKNMYTHIQKEPTNIPSAHRELPEWQGPAFLIANIKINKNHIKCILKSHCQTKG